ncbi:MAG: tetratricopeptide repeat protein [Anaerolineae bacterium]|nr:tetratricopeptide repeat protein [Anaerolineae bacterium]
MSPSELLAEYAGALVTTDVINREDLLEEIRQALHGEGTRVFYIRGAGGIGKTCLLRAVLRRCGPGGPWYRENLIAPSPEKLVDLYHTIHHTREGLAYALRHSLPAPEGGFARFDEAWGKWETEKYDLAGMLKELSLLQEGVLQAFVEDLNALAEQGHRPVLVLDTAERLLYGEDEIQRRLGLEPERTEALKWMLEILPKLKNAVVLIAGRPEPARLKDDLKRALGDRLEVRELAPFGLEETKQYFDAVAARARELGWEEKAKQIEGIPDDVREVIYHYTGGRPILLALMIDYLLRTDLLPPQMKEPVEEVRSQSEEERKSVQENVERELVRFWMETDRPADQAIIALAWTPKGVNPDLLAQVLELGRSEGDGWDIEQAGGWLDAVRELSFVKFRPADGRTFLHDEMYALFRKHVLAYASSTERERIYQAILKYYSDRIEYQRKEVARLSHPGHPTRPEIVLGMPQPPADPMALARATDELWRLMAEEVYYRLRHSPVDGFQSYQAYAKESYWSQEDALARLLYSEMLEFLREFREVESFDGLSRETLEINIGGLQRIERLRRENRFWEAVHLARRIRQECADLLARSGPLVRLQLQILEAESQTYLGQDLSEAEQLLRDTLWDLEEFRPGNPFERWQQETLRAEAYNALGYCYRNMGWFRRAAEAYGRAIRQWRALEDRETDELRKAGLRAQHANTLNNLAWALAELGHFARATQVGEDALEMRVSLGPAAPVALSLNTLSMVLVRDDKPHRARVLSSRALAIFRDKGYPRGIGLASIALAEALRRMSAIPYLYIPQEAVELLRQAIRYATEAVEIFDPQGPVPERSRLAEALIERGCVYRQWAWFRPLYESLEDPPQEKLAEWSEADLLRAMEVAGDILPYRHLDAHVDLAWLYYYIRDHEKARKTAQAALDSVPKEYRLDHGLPDVERLPYTFYWFLQGKTYLLLGELMWREFAAAKKAELLEPCGKNYTLALAYDELYAPDFRDLRGALSRIYKRIRGLNEEEFRVFHRGIARAVEQYGLRTPTRLDRALMEWGFPTRL